MILQQENRKVYGYILFWFSSNLVVKDKDVYVYIMSVCLHLLIPVDFSAFSYYNTP